MEPEINDLIYRFKERLKVLNLSSITICNYQKYVIEFLEAVNADDTKKITRGIIESYICTLYNRRYTKSHSPDEKEKPYTISTISVRIRAIKRFFEFLEFGNEIFVNPAEFIKEPKKIKRDPRSILTPDEAKRLLEIPNLGQITGIRDRAVLEVFYTTGIRMMELSNLSIYDVDLQSGLLRINKGKGAKDRVVPLGRHAVRFLREYITRVRPILTKQNRSSRHLFVNRHSRPLDKQVISIMIRESARQAGIKKQVTAHTFRHTFATQLIKNGAEPAAVQKMLGHFSFSTTQEYIRLAGTSVKKDHKITHPREQDKEAKEVISPSIERKRPKRDNPE